MQNVTIQTKIHFKSGRRNRKEMRVGDERDAASPGRIPRVSRLMALAIRFDRLIQDGVIADQTELARLGHVTEARISQIMKLLYLAPDIQEAVLRLPLVRRGKDSITERTLRPIMAVADWRKQRRAWQRVYVRRRGR